MFSRPFAITSHRISSKSNFTVCEKAILLRHLSRQVIFLIIYRANRILYLNVLQNIVRHRSVHLACRNLKKNFIVCAEQKYRIQLPIINVSFIRHQSGSASQAGNTSIDG